MAYRLSIYIYRCLGINKVANKPSVRKLERQNS